MFKFLKEKLGNWTKKLKKGAEKKPEEIAEEIEEEKETKEKLRKEIEVPKPGEPLKIIKEEPEKEEIKGIFQKIKEKIGKIEIKEEDFEKYSEDLEQLLLENNVALEVTEKIIQELRENLVGKHILKKELEGEVKDSLREILEKILIEPFNIIEKIKEHAEKSQKPFVIVFFGINGSGKTTTIAKFAYLLEKNNISCIMAASDTFRAAAIEQLKKHGEKLNIKVISHEYGSDPASVGFDAIKYAEKNHINVVLIDTAGRMHTNKNLLNEMEKICRVNKPDEKIFVGESITGNDATQQAKNFNEAIGIDGIILSKADVDEKGGTALSVGYITSKPILFLGTGQKYDDLEPFNKNNFLEKLGL